MKLLWTAVKVVLALALAVPVLIIVLGAALGILGALVGLAVTVLKLAVVGAIAWGVFKLASAMMGRKSSRPDPVATRQLPPVDPYYEAAKRELDRELGHLPR